jgi:hypothetical protein
MPGVYGYNNMKKQKVGNTGRIRNIRGENSTELIRRCYGYKLQRMPYCRYRLKQEIPQSLRA